MGSNAHYLGTVTLWYSGPGKILQPPLPRRHFWLLRCMVVEARDAANCLTMCRKALVIRITQAQISTVARQRSPDPPPPYYPGQKTTVPDFPVRLPITVLPMEVASRTYRYMDFYCCIWSLEKGLKISQLNQALSPQRGLLMIQMPACMTLCHM